ncbi:SGNH hydrolase domain-containing protein [Pseudomonas sp. NPDC089547]|uniref:SGNH hydrolase domain-containing protein n=1 Tax=Pseudomonas sp. NPDC089547 TaxID=3390652 RepID=UPI003D04FC7D
MVVGYILVENSGYWPTAGSYTFKKEIYTHNFNTLPASKFPFNCQMNKYEPAKWKLDQCVNGDKFVEPETLRWGDSSAAHYVGYLKAVAESGHFSIRNISHSPCPQVKVADGVVSPALENSCKAFNESAFAESKKYKTVIVGAAWEGYAKRGGRAQIAKTICELAANGNQVIIALNVPVLTGLDRMCSAKAIRIPGMDCPSRAVMLDKGDSEVNNSLKEQANRYSNVTTFDVRSQICKNGTCSAYDQGTLLYYDSGHMSMVGSELIGKAVVKSGQVPLPIAAHSPATHHVGQNTSQLDRIEASLA